MMARIRSAFWTLLPWWWPDFLPMPPSWLEQIERQVYDGMTRHEWCQLQVDEYHASVAARTTPPSSVAGEKK